MSSQLSVLPFLHGRPSGGLLAARSAMPSLSSSVSHASPPALEGIKLNGRWVVVYSKYDIGCALENHQSSDCRGHDRASALRLAAAAVLYALKK